MDFTEAFEVATGQATIDTRVLHVRVLGRSVDIELREIGVSGANSDGEIVKAVANHLDIAPAMLANTVIERHENGNVSVRPAAIFG